MLGIKKTDFLRFFLIFRSGENIAMKIEIASIEQSIVKKFNLNFSKHYFLNFF